MGRSDTSRPKTCARPKSQICNKMGRRSSGLSAATAVAVVGVMWRGGRAGCHLGAAVWPVEQDVFELEVAVADALPVHEGESAHRASRDGGRLRLGKDRVLVDEGKELAARTVFHYYVVDAIDAAVVKECAEVGVAGGGDDPQRLKLGRRPATSARGGAG